MYVYCRGTSALYQVGTAVQVHYMHKYRLRPYGILSTVDIITTTFSAELWWDKRPVGNHARSAS